MKNYPSLGVQIPEILLPKSELDYSKWAVIACDQFTSEPDYWRQVEEIVGEAPSTYHMVLPEIFLGTKEEESRLFSTQEVMKQYLSNNIFKTINNLILVERYSSGKTRHGLLLALDLEKYDFSLGSQSLIRATEGTIIERLPPRIKIREKALLEMPHILVLIDDPLRTVIEPLIAKKSQLNKLYDFDLMLNSGHLIGYEVTNQALEDEVIISLTKLASKESFDQKYPHVKGKDLLLYAIGDGNHSLATAKSIWEQIKHRVPTDHPARYALIELENVHDEGLEFEPIHRILFSVTVNINEVMRDFYNGKVQINKVDNLQMLIKKIEFREGKGHLFGIITSEGYSIARLDQPTQNLPVGSLQPFLDSLINNGGAERIDYVHGVDVIEQVAREKGNVGFLLPAMSKNDLFRTVVLDGALPRKTFSMGEAIDKRFYMECRKIV